MNNEIFRSEFRNWVVTGHVQLLDTIPSGSGVFRTIDIPAEQYQTGYVSTDAGSFKKLLESGNWHASDFPLARIEGKITGHCIYEARQFNQAVPVVNAFRLPDEFLHAIYADRDLPSGALFAKSHIIMDELSQFIPRTTYSGVYFPTRRTSSGGIIVFNPQHIPTTLIYSGETPPPFDLI